MSAILIEENIVHYEALGRGKPIIFLHGWVGSWRYWVQAMQAASTSYRAYALDFWGFGESAKEEKFYHLDCQVELLDQFMNAMGIGKVALIGHGLGAVVALLYAERHPFVVDRTMFISLPVETKSVLERAGSTTPTNLASRLMEQSTVTANTQKEILKTDEAAIQMTMAETEKIDVLDVIGKMETASLVVHGENDPLSPGLDLGSNGQLPTMFHHIIFNQSGHFPMLEQTSKFHRLMQDFLDLPSGESPSQLQVKEEWKRRVR